MKARVTLKSFNDFVAQSIGADTPPPQGFVPESMEELQAILEDGFRLPYEMEMELGVQMVREENNWKLLRRQLRREFIINGAAACKIWVDRISQRVKMRQCDLANFVIEDFYGNDGDASKGIGEVLTYTISECRLEWGDQFTDKQYYEIAKSAVGQYGNPYQIGVYQEYVNSDAQYTLYREWDNFKILVFDFEVYSCDRIKKEFTTKSGNLNSYSVPFETPVTPKIEKTSADGTIYSREIKAIDIKTVRGGKWIINTKFMADWGKKADIARPNENKKECYREFKFYRATNKSVLELVLPTLDALQLAVLYKNNTLAKAMPSGYEIEMTAFEKVFVDGKLKNSEELFTIAAETGNVIYRNTFTFEDDGRVSQISPIKWVERDITPALQGWWIEVKNNIELIRTISGVNDMMDASTPPAEQPVATSELALQGAENSLSPIIFGMLQMDEMIAYMILLKMQVIARNGNISGYVTLGDGFKRLIEIGSNISTLSYATRVQALPTQEQKQQIMQMIQEAVTSNLQAGLGGQEAPDYLDIERHLATGGNLKVAAMMLRKANRKAAELIQRNKMAADQANSQGMLQAAQGTEEAKGKSLQLEYTLKAQLDDHLTANKLKIIEAESKLGLRHAVTDSALEKDVLSHKNKLEVDRKTA
jgi:hypothetical protein